jgi:hypothetical protein
MKTEKVLHPVQSSQQKGYTRTMANNAASYKYFVGFKFTALEAEEQAAVRRGMREGYLRIEPGTRIVRSA